VFSNEDLKDPNSAYYKEALEWHNEKYNLAIKQRKTGWSLAVAFAFLSLILALTLLLLVPLKTTVREVIEVDRLTGETQVKRALKEGGLNQSEALIKYWLVKYVNARLTYDRQDIEQNYEKVKMLSDKRSFNVYASAFDPSKDDSPYQIYGEHTVIKTTIRHISFLNKNTVSIGVYLTEITNDKETSTPWVITASYQFTLEPRSEIERFENPLGFQVTKWRIDEEIESGEKK